jgi:hypothetical protein
MGKKKHEIITFKADESLNKALMSVPNRSEFIRNAIMTALENVCPLCRGTGTLTPDQLKHWDNFSKNHSLTECKRCHEFHLVCNADNSENKKC